jgi:hypothetical protein
MHGRFHSSIVGAHPRREPAHSCGMSTRLGPVLSRLDLPVVELGAMALDGEVYRIDDGFSAIDAVPGPALRAASLALHLPERLIAEQHSAAWIWGATSVPPTRHEVCADITARKRPSLDTRLIVREVVIEPADIELIAGVMVTRPLRTAVDLARFVVDWSDSDRLLVAALLDLGGATLRDCAAHMDRRRNLPGKKRALERLAGAARIGKDAGSR